MIELYTLPSPGGQGGSFTCVLHFQLKSHFGGAQWVKVFSTGGLGGPLWLVKVPRSPFCLEGLLAARSHQGSVAGHLGIGVGGQALGFSPPRHHGGLGAEAPEMRLEPRGGSVPSQQAWEWRPLALAGCGEGGGSYGCSPKDPTLLEVSSSVSVVCTKTCKSHLLLKPNDSEAQ